MATTTNTSTALALERVLGLTSLHNCALSSHSSSGEVAYASGCVVVLYHPKRNKQTRYFRAAKPISSISFSHGGEFLAVGERGLKPAVIIWDIKSGEVIAELKGHKYGIAALAWSPDASFLVSIGYKFDKQILLWKNNYLFKHISNNQSNLKNEFIQCGKAKVNHRIHAVCFSYDGTTFVTCGEKHVKWWNITPLLTPSSEPSSDSTPSSTPSPPLPPTNENVILLPPKPPTSTQEVQKVEEIKPIKKEVIELKGKVATIIESHKGSCFIDITCGVNGKCFALSTKGILCSFDEKTASLTSFVALEATNGYCISLQQWYSHHTDQNKEFHEQALIAVGCSDGLVRLFNSYNLQYLVTLPQPPPVGYLNFKSVEELTQLTTKYNLAHEKYHLNLIEYEKDKKMNNHLNENNDLEEEDDELLSPQKPPSLQYPACVALRWLNKSQSVHSKTNHLSPPSSTSSSSTISSSTLMEQSPIPPTHLVAIYGDRSLFVWDVSKSTSSKQSQEEPQDQNSTSTFEHVPIQQDELVIGKYRSFQNHSSCIWDVSPMPESYGEGYGSMFFSCAADNTVRLWCLDGNAHHHHHHHHHQHNTKASNFFSKDLIHAFNCDPSSSPPAQKESIDDSSLQTQKINMINHSNNEETYHLPHACDMGGTVFIGGEVDLDTPCRVDNPLQLACPRVIAISPNGDEIACGDRVGNLRIWSIKSSSLRSSDQLNSNDILYDLMFTAKAHDAEILCLDYTFQTEVNIANHHQPHVYHSYSQSSNEGTMSVLLASGARDCLIHVLGSSESRTLPKHCLLQTLEHHESAVTSLKFSQDGRKLFSIGAEGSLVLSKVDARNKSSQNLINDSPPPPSSSAVSSAVSSPTLTIDSSSTTSPPSIEEDASDLKNRIHRYRTVSLLNGVSYDIGNEITGKYIVCAGQTDCKLHIYSSSSGKHLRSYSADPNDGFEMMHKENKKIKKTVTSEIYKIDLCPAGMYLATCSFDRWIRLIDFYSGQVVAQVSGHAELVTSLRFSADGKRLISTGGDGCVFIWKLNHQITSAMNDRIIELKLIKQKKEADDQSRQMKLQDPVVSSSASPTTPLHTAVVKPNNETSQGDLNEPESPPDVREVRLSDHQTLFDDSPINRSHNITPPPNNQKEEVTSIPSQENQNHPVSPGRVLQGKWAQGVAASGGGYDVLGKYHVSPPTGDDPQEKYQQTLNEQDGELNIEKLEEVTQDMNQTMFSTTTHFKDEDENKEDISFQPLLMKTTRNFTEEESKEKEEEDDEENEEEEDALMKSVEELDGVILGESPRQQNKPFSFDDENSTTEDDDVDDDDDDNDTNNGDDDSDDIEELEEIEKTIINKEETEIGGNSFIGDEVRSSWKSIDINTYLNDKTNHLNTNIETNDTNNNDQINQEIELNNQLLISSPSNSTDVLSFSTSFRRSTSASTNPLNIDDSSKSQKTTINKSSLEENKLIDQLHDEKSGGNSNNENIETIIDVYDSPPRPTRGFHNNLLVENENQSLNDETSIHSPSFNAPLPSSALIHNNVESNHRLQVPGSAGGGFSTPSKESRNKKHSFPDATGCSLGSGAGISSSMPSRSSTASSRTLSEERERLRSRDKRRDTASALASMNDQLLKMGILKQMPTGVNDNNSHPLKPQTNVVVGESMPNLYENQTTITDSQVQRPSTADPTTIREKEDRGRDSLKKDTGEGGYISPEESGSSLQSLEITEKSLQASLATTVSGTSDEEEDNGPEDNEHQSNMEGTFDSSKMDHTEEVIQVNVLPRVDTTNVSLSSSLPLPRPLSEYRMSLQRLQDAVVETARLYQELQQHTSSSQSPISASPNKSPLKSPSSVDSIQHHHGGNQKDQSSLSSQFREDNTSMTSPETAVSPTRIIRKPHQREVRHDDEDSGGDNALRLLNEFASTWESVGGFVAHSQQSIASSRSAGGGYNIDSSLSSLTSPSMSSDSSGSFSSFPSFHYRPLSGSVIGGSLVNLESPPQEPGNLGLPPILERGESALENPLGDNCGGLVAPNSPPQNIPNIVLEEEEELEPNKEVDEFALSTGSMLGSPPSRPAPPPPPTASQLSNNHTATPPIIGTNNEILMPNKDNQFKDQPSMKHEINKHPAGDEQMQNVLSGAADMDGPSPEVSLILEKYSDVLFGMVQQKLHVSQSSSLSVLTNQSAPASSTTLHPSSTASSDPPPSRENDLQDR